MLRVFLTGLLIVVVMCACQEQASRQPAGGQPTAGEDVAPIKKIAIENRAQVDSLMALGVEIIVIEQEYVAARIPADKVSALADLGLQSQPIKEEELTQRLVKIVAPTPEDRNKLAGLGIDIWEARGDTIVAQVFDKHLMQAENMGFSVEMVAENVQNLAEKKAEK